jgi:hypothetical protein
MSRITLDDSLKARLNGLNDVVEVCDAANRAVGVFLPWEQYKKLLYRDVKVPLAPDEIERRRQEQGGCTLEELWRKLGRS